jgi:polar amino acid transport system substrate-binding protein
MQTLLLPGIVFFGAMASANAQQTTVHAINSSASQPFAFVVDGGPSQGLMIDLCNAIAEDNGWTIDYRAMVFGELLPTLSSGQADMICSSFTNTPERAAQVNFTPTVFTFGEGMIVPKTDTTAYQTWADVASQPVGTLRGSTYHTAMEATGMFTDLHLYDTTPEGVAAVSNGEIVAFFTLGPILSYLAANDFPDLQLVATYQPAVIGEYAIAVRKDAPDLLAAVNASLAKLGAAGTIQNILGNWGL